MKKQIKRVLALFLSAIMVLSIVPTSLFAMAEVSASKATISDVADSATLNKLSVSTAVPTTVKTQFATNAFTTRAQKNLVAKSEVSLYTDATQNALVTQNNSNINLATLSNGVIANTTNGTRNEDRNYMSSAFSQNNAYLTVELDKYYDISDIYIFSSDASGDSLYDYEVYISETKEGLYNAENLVVDFNYNGYEQYDDNRYKGKINQVDFELAQEAISANKYNKVTNANAEGQEYVLGTDIKGKYVGVKLNSYSKNNLFRVSEVGVEGAACAGQPTDENVTTDVTNNDVANKLSVTASVPTTLTTQFGADAFATRKGNNLLAKGNILGMFTDAEQTTQVKFAAKYDGDVEVKPESSVSWQKAAMTDGEIPVVGQTEPQHITGYSYALNQNSGYLTMQLDAFYQVSDFYMIASDKCNYSPYDYEIYISEEQSSLYNYENIVVKYQYNGYDTYSGNNYKGKINQTNFALAQSSIDASNHKDATGGVAEGQIYKFNEDIKGKYVGIKFYSFSKYVEFLRVYEIGIEGKLSPGQPTGDLVTTDIQDATVAEKLNLKTTLPTTLTTQFPLDAFATRKDNNLVKKATEFVMYTDDSQTTPITLGGETVNWQQAAMADGLIASKVDGVDNETQRLSDYSGFLDQTHGYLTIALDKSYDIGDIYIASRENGNDSLCNYEIYVSETREDLYNIENIVVDFLYSGYGAEGVGKMNKVTVPGATTSSIAEVQDYKFAKPATGKYVGIKMNTFNTKNSGHNRVYEIGVEEIEYFALDCEHSKGDTYVTGEVAATCSKEGYTGDTYCNDCGNLAKKGTKIAKLAHKQVSTTTKATLTKNGTIKYTCSVCKATTKTATTIYYPKTIKLSTTTYTYSGGVKKPSVSVVDSNGKTISSSNYTAPVPSAKYPGKYSVKITFKGNCNYTGSKTLYFTITPKKVSLSSVKSTSKKKMTVKWSKQSGVSGYQVVYATNSKFTKGKKTVTVKGSSAKYKTVTKLSSKKTYYVKVRSYKTIDGKKVYGSYSKVKKVKVK